MDLDTFDPDSSILFRIYFFLIGRFLYGVEIN